MHTAHGHGFPELGINDDLGNMVVQVQVVFSYTRVNVVACGRLPVLSCRPSKKPSKDWSKDCFSYAGLVQRDKKVASSGNTTTTTTKMNSAAAAPAVAP
jgi:hypothetical protein